MSLLAPRRENPNLLGRDARREVSLETNLGVAKVDFKNLQKYTSRQQHAAPPALFLFTKVLGDRPDDSKS